MTFYLDSSLVGKRRAKAYEEELLLRVSCFERDVLNQILCSLELPAICSL